MVGQNRAKSVRDHVGGNRCLVQQPLFRFLFFRLGVRGMAREAGLGLEAGVEVEVGLEAGLGLKVGLEAGLERQGKRYEYG